MSSEQQAPSQIEHVDVDRKALAGKPFFVSSGRTRAMDESLLFGQNPHDLLTATADNSDTRQLIQPALPSVGKRQQGTVTLYRIPRLIRPPRDPYSESERKRAEDAVKKNWCVRAAIAIRAFFCFGKGSELHIEFPAEETQGFDDKQIAASIKQDPEFQDLLRQIDLIDQKVGLNRAVEKFYWQMMAQGRACIIKMFESPESENITELKCVNSRRLGMPITDPEQNWKLVGLLVDGSGLQIESTIYDAYDDMEIVPYSEHYGFSPVSAVADIAETVNLAVIEDFKEIFTSAWLATLLFTIDTAGYDDAEAQARLRAFIAAFKAGKKMAVNEAVTTQTIEQKADWSGLVEAVREMEMKIFKGMAVPQFLVQDESAANRATAEQSAALFINGVIAHDQQKITDLLADQYYDDLLRKILRQRGNVPQFKLPQQSTPSANSDPGASPVAKAPATATAAAIQPAATPNAQYIENNPLPFRVKRVWNQAKISDFTDLAASVVALKNAGIWDIQKCNEVLGSEEVTARAMQEQQRQEAMQQQKDQQRLEVQKQAIQQGQKTQETQQQVAQAVAKLADANRTPS
jgi:hypothetical protein